MYNILDDLKHRLDKLSSPRSRVVMYNNCLQIVNLIRHCQERDYLKDISNSLFELMVEKSLMYSYRLTFERTANEALLDVQLNNNGRNQTRLESALETLQDPGRLHSTGANLRPVTEQVKNRIALLFQFANNVIFTYHSEMCLPEEKSSTRTERSYAIEQDVGEEGEEEKHVLEEEDQPEVMVSDSVMAINGRTNNIKEFSMVQQEFDREFADRVNTLCKERTPEKMSKCPCNIQPTHSTKFGSVRFCAKYLKIPDVEARKQFIRSRRLCNNCLRKDHTAASCRMKTLNCFYCKEALKSNSGHNSSLCTNFTDEEFKIIKNKFEEKDRERKTRENRRRRQ